MTAKQRQSDHPRHVETRIRNFPPPGSPEFGFSLIVWLIITPLHKCKHCLHNKFDV